MTSTRFSLLVLTVAMTLSACATKPIPDTFASLNTYEIAQRARCEMRDALNAMVAKGLGTALRKYDKVIPSKVTPCCGQEPPAPTVEKDRTFRPLDELRIAYEFTFDIKENNDLTGNLDFFDLITAGTFSLGITAENKRERKNFRNFRIYELSKDLMGSSEMAKMCTDIKSGVGVQYPITGEIGLEESVLTFLKLYETGIVTGPATSTQDIAILGDTIEFTTTVGGSINPSINLNGPRSNISLDKTGIGVNLLRTDKHKLSLALSIVPGKSARIQPDEAAKLASRGASTEREGRAAASLNEDQIRAAILGELDRQRRILFQQDVTVIQE